jgi:hypothetical protein
VNGYVQTRVDGVRLPIQRVLRALGPLDDLVYATNDLAILQPRWCPLPR